MVAEIGFASGHRYNGHYQLDVKTSRWLNDSMNSDTPTKVISLRLRPELARAFKMEAAQRGLKLNALFEEMFRTFREKGDSESERGEARKNG